MRPFHNLVMGPDRTMTCTLCGVTWGDCNRFDFLNMSRMHCDVKDPRFCPVRKNTMCWKVECRETCILRSDDVTSSDAHDTPHHTDVLDGSADYVLHTS